MCSFLNDLLFFLRDKGPSKQMIRTKSTLAEIRVVLILCLDWKVRKGFVWFHVTAAA